MRKRLSQGHILGILQEIRDGESEINVCRKHNVSSTSLYRWKKQYWTDVPEIERQLKLKEEENRILKAILADKEFEIYRLKAMGRNTIVTLV
jgi:putative transposase